VNFFEHQEQSRRHTRWLVFLFALALLAIIVAVQLALMLGLQWSGTFSGTSVFSAAGLQQHAGLLAGAGLATASVVGLASLFKTLQLRGGGGEVARQLGGIQVDADTRDPLKRRLYNVVEEIAIASGTPVPEVYVLEREAGINAFAAGYSPSDAAVAVTRGTLEKLSRSELQGVVAHEFSHILNGDMRINIRLMGALFGILLLALIGRRVLFHSRYLGRSRDRNGAPVIAIALVLMLVGYVGLFFGRWIKSSVSRTREYLADASAVQFTRNPDGIAGALKKIAVYNDASWLQADTEEVGHMLFGPGQRMPLFATHPPLLKRIARIEPGFREQQLQDLAEKIKRDAERAERKQAREDSRPEPKRGPLDAANIIEQIGNPDMQQLLLAAAVAGGLAAPVRQVADSPEQAPGLLLYSLLHQDPVARDRQLLVIAQRLGAQVEHEVRALVAQAGTASPVQRLPLLEIALPNLRRHPPERVKALLQAVDEIIRVDGHIEVFEYLLARLVR
jgi:Zn-dependent protease with chaperone function